MSLEVHAATLGELLESGQTDKALALLGTLRPADAADLLESLDDERLAQVVEIWAPTAAAAAIVELEEHRQASLAERIPAERLADILDAMSPDDAASFLECIDPDRRARLLGRMEREEASEVAELLDYPEGSAGRLMSPDFVAVGEDATAEGVIARLRAVPEDVELVYYVYVLGGSEQLKGVVSLRRLIMAEPNTPVGQLMETDLV
ncbi:MAG: magnesium transporter MgtE N-terminal domain-containing protein, partial [Acidimicrobiia bacterium]